MADIRDYYSQFPFVRNCALEFGDPQGNNDQAGEMRNLSRFVKDRVTYQADPNGYEFVTAPDFMLGEILAHGTVYGDCDDHVLLYNTLMMSLGFETAFIAVKIDPSSELFDHVISGVKYEGQWVDVDLCAKTVVTPAYLEKFVQL